MREVLGLLAERRGPDDAERELDATTPVRASSAAWSEKDADSGPA